MSRIHEGNITLKHAFNEAWEFLIKEGEINLETEKRGTPFQVRASTTTKGSHQGERVIVFYRSGKERARSYPCCWGHYSNCNQTWIGMYCKALDNFMP